MKDKFARLAPVLLVPVVALFVTLMNACAAPEPEPTEGKGESTSAISYRSETYSGDRPAYDRPAPGGYSSEATKVTAPPTDSAGDDDDDDDTTK
jgi:hypothetical protein